MLCSLEEGLLSHGLLKQVDKQGWLSHTDCEVTCWTIGRVSALIVEVSSASEERHWVEDASKGKVNLITVGSTAESAEVNTG